jgi:aerobic carbon-monoxide dehydrogenase small subunit
VRKLKQVLTLNVNKETYEVLVEPSRTLLEVLRDELSLTGAKEGCGQGECGTCTVLIDGRPELACLLLAATVQGHEILTIEGLADADANGIDPLQESFIEKGAVQCGFCTPGMILSAKALLNQNPHPNREEIKRGIAGNLCRCTGYQKVVDAIESASQCATVKQK